MQSRLLLFTCAALATACGDGDGSLLDGPPLEFVNLEVSAGDPAPGACTISGCVGLPEGTQCLNAKMEATGVPGVCPLDVASDRSVTGSCRTPGKELRDFQVIWYAYAGPQEVTVARATTQLDLRQVRQASLPLTFGADTTQADFDDDLDNKTNLAELCAGTDPLVPD